MYHHNWIFLLKWKGNHIHRKLASFQNIHLTNNKPNVKTTGRSAKVKANTIINYIIYSEINQLLYNFAYAKTYVCVLCSELFPCHDNTPYCRRKEVFPNTLITVNLWLLLLEHNVVLQLFIMGCQL